MLQGTIEYPGLYTVNGATVTIGHGITPSAFSIRVAPQPSVPAASGNITLRFANQVIVFPECKIDQVTFTTDGANMIDVTLLDRRWKWQFGAISGQYNVRNVDGTVRGFGAADNRAAYNSERTPQQLASLCLDAMGERSYDVGQLPNNTRPEVDWDYTNPAAALAELCDQLGCRVMLTLDNRVVIRRLGIGRGLPAGGPIHRRAATIDPAEMPDVLGIVCGPNLYQVDLRLIAVGEEIDGSLKPIDELSYKPAAGWTITDIPHFNCVADLTLRELAKRSVFRYYQPRMPAEIPGWEGSPVQVLKQILPLGGAQVDVTRVAGEELPRPAIVFGVWTSEGGESVNQAAALRPVDDDQDETCLQDFSIDENRGIVITGDYTYKLTGTVPTLAIDEADLVLRTAVTVRDAETMSLMRYVRSIPNRGQRFNTRPRYVPHDEIRLTHRCRYLPAGGDEYPPGRVTTNVRQVDRECDYYLAAEAEQYRTITPETITYAGLYPVELDGLIQRITWNVGAPFASTTVELGRDAGIPSALPYRLLRGLERMRAATDLARQADRRRKKNPEGPTLPKIG